MAMQSLRGSVAIVTGGSRGIGRAISLALGEQKFTVIVNYAGNKEAADGLVAEVVGTGRLVLALQADVTNLEEAQRCVETIEKSWGGSVNVLVNNAGIIRDDLFVRLEPEAWNAVLQTNLGGTYNFTRAVAYSMMRQRKGRIINLSSIAAEHTNPGQTNYAASKGAINAFTRALASFLYGVHALDPLTFVAVRPSLLPWRSSLVSLRLGRRLGSIL